MSCCVDQFVLAHGAEATQEGRADGRKQRVEACRGSTKGFKSFFSFHYCSNVFTTLVHFVLVYQYYDVGF